MLTANTEYSQKNKIVGFVILFFFLTLIYNEASTANSSCYCQDRNDLAESDPLLIFGNPANDQKLIFCGDIEKRTNLDVLIASSVKVIDCFTNKIILNLDDVEEDSDLCKIENRHKNVAINYWKKHVSYYVQYEKNEIVIKKSELSKKMTKRKDFPFYRSKLAHNRFGFPGFNAEGFWPVNLKSVQVIEDESKYSDDGYIRCRAIVFEDGSKVEINYTESGDVGSEIYQRGGWSYKTKTERNIDYKKNVNLVGIRLQYFPDCVHDEHGYSGEFPAMIIYVFRDGTSHTYYFYPDGTKKNNFGISEGNNILLFNDD